MEEIEVFTLIIPVVKAMRDPNLCDRHWDMINSLLKVKIDPNDLNLTLQQLIDIKIHKKKEDIVEIANRANKESELLKNLQVIKD